MIPDDLPNLFETPTIEGWSTQVGAAVALVAVLVIVAAVLDRRPVAYLALMATYLGAALAVDVRFSADIYAGAAIDYDVAYGTYAGVAGAAVSGLAAATTLRLDFLRGLTPARFAVAGLVAALLVAFLLPWARIPALASVPGIASPAALIAAALAALIIYRWTKRVVLGAALAIFTGAAASSFTEDAEAAYAYGLWVGVGLAVAAAVTTLLTSIQRLGLPQLSWRALPRLVAVAALLISFFLPWQIRCFEGSCTSTNAWITLLAATAALLAVAHAVMPATELAVGIAVLIATLGFQLVESDVPDLRLEYGYGSTVGFAAAALIALLAVVGLRRPHVERVRIVPSALSVAYIAVLIVPLWFVLPERWQTLVRFGSSSWLLIAGVLLAIGLAGLWLRGERTDWLAIVPLVMAALATPDVILTLERRIAAGPFIALGLCTLLAVLGRIENGSGLRNVRVPEILRVDRL